MLILVLVEKGMINVIQNEGLDTVLQRIVKNWLNQTDL